MNSDNRVIKLYDFCHDWTGTDKTTAIVHKLCKPRSEAHQRKSCSVTKSTGSTHVAKVYVFVFEGNIKSA